MPGLLFIVQITQLQLVPPLVVFLAKNPDVRPSDLSGVTRILSGAAPLGKEVTIELEKKCNVQIFQGKHLFIRNNIASNKEYQVSCLL